MSSRLEKFRERICDEDHIQRNHSLNQRRLRKIHDEQENFYQPLPRKVLMAQRRRRRAIFARIYPNDEELIAEAIQRYTDNLAEAEQYCLLN